MQTADKENIPNTPLKIPQTPKHKTPYKTPKKYVVYPDQPEIQKPLFSEQELVAIQQMIRSLEIELQQTKEMLIEKTGLLEKTNQKLKEAEDSATEWKEKCKSQRRTFLDNLESFKNMKEEVRKLKLENEKLKASNDVEKVYLKSISTDSICSIKNKYQH
jgi:septal ring factor EnvC (AmiA/AmiB activator)